VTPRLLALAVVLVLSLARPSSGVASDSSLSGGEAHPRGRFPLALYTAPRDDARLAAAVSRAVRDWNAMFQDTLGLPAFTSAAQPDDAAVVVTFEPTLASRAMGVTYVTADTAGVIQLPVRVVVAEAVARGETARDIVLYQVVAHELGHALGLPHTTDPRSIMCCVAGSIDFGDPRVREAYIDARRHPDLLSVRAEVLTHYRRFWQQRGEKLSHR
jgi:Matrixin